MRTVSVDGDSRGNCSILLLVVVTNQCPLFTSSRIQGQQAISNDLIRMESLMMEIIKFLSHLKSNFME